MKAALAWWPWLACAAVLLALGLQRAHVTQSWLANGAFLACALLLVVGTCRRAGRKDAASKSSTEDDRWT